jgi:hypothetical protein
VTGESVDAMRDDLWDHQVDRIGAHRQSYEQENETPVRF